MPRCKHWQIHSPSLSLFLVFKGKALIFEILKILVYEINLFFFWILENTKDGKNFEKEIGTSMICGDMGILCYGHCVSFPYLLSKKKIPHSEIPWERITFGFFLNEAKNSF